MIDLTGMLFPATAEAQPIWLNITGSDDLYLPLFKTLSDLNTAMRTLNISCDIVKRIDNHQIFLESVPYKFYDDTRIRIIIDPRPSDTGTILFTEVYRSDEDIPPYIKSDED